jgi:hypothetical protein
MEWLYTEAMLLFFSAKSLFFMVCQLRIIIPKKRGSGSVVRRVEEITMKNKRHRKRFGTQEVAFANDPYQLVRKPTARRKERMIGM